MADREQQVLQRAYKLQAKKGPNGNEYVVRGAEVFCGWGTKSCVLNLPIDHGVSTDDNRPLITHKDCTSANISGFGTCRFSDEPCRPVLNQWEYSERNDKIFNRRTLENEYAVTRNSTAVCKNASVQGASPAARVAFASSGQTAPDYTDKELEHAIDIYEDVSRRWWRGNDGRDFLGYIKPAHTGIYNFRVRVENMENYQGGSLFIYQTEGWLKKRFQYVGAYDLTIFADSSKEVWNVCTDIVLKKGVNYYFEVDFPNLDYFSYSLTGNQDLGELGGEIEDKQKREALEKEGFSTTKISAMWVIGSEFEQFYQKEYGVFVNENGGMVPVVVLYLNTWYRELLSSALLRYLNNDKLLISRDFLSKATTVGGVVTTIASYVNVGSAVVSVASYLCTAVGAIITFLPDSKIEALQKKLAENESREPIKVCIYLRHSDSVYYMDHPLGAAAAPDPVSLEYEDFSEYEPEKLIQIKGVKYLKGTWQYFYGFDPRLVERPDVIDDIYNQMKPILEKVDKENK